MTDNQFTIEEIWKPVVGYENLYSVSNTGNIRRHLFYPEPHTRAMKPKVEKTGYLRLSLSKENVVKTWSVHTIVAYAFLGKRPCGLVINHIDGNKQNNNAENLEYVTNKQNMEHAAKNNLLSAGKRHGDIVRAKTARGDNHYSRRNPERANRGEKHGRAKISEDTARQIRALINSGTKCAEIARRFNINPHTVYDIKYGVAWAHVV